MKSQLIKTLSMTAAVTLSTAASADTRIIEVWNCKMLDGNKVEQMQATNKTWLTFVNGAVQGGGVRSYVMTSVVGDLESFMFVDSYPSMASWVEAKAALETPEGLAADAPNLSVSKCTSNTLNKSTEI